MTEFVTIIAARLNLSEMRVNATLRLLNEGYTIPFIARYRKEQTGELNEVEIADINSEYEQLKETAKRKETILKTIAEQGKLTPELREQIEKNWNNTELEDIYLPYKPKRRTRAQIARQSGLEPLAQIIMLQREQHPEQVARAYVKGEVHNVADAILGAQDIIAEQIAEDIQARNGLRKQFERFATINSRVVKSKQETDEAAKYRSYFNVSEPLNRCSANRLLAMRRGEAEGCLRVSITVDDERAIERLERQFVHGKGECSQLVKDTVKDSYHRLLLPSIENEFASLSKQRADEDAIKIFQENLHQLLLAAPLGQKRVMGIDPGFRTGCKLVCLDAEGNLLHHDVIYPHPPQRFRGQASFLVNDLLEEYNIQAIAIGNGTASRETRAFIEEVLAGNTEIQVFVVSEDGASVYSASEVAREEFPDEDVTVRGAVSIGRRLMDPLAELVKIDARSMGIGQYQHDVDQNKLKKSLDQTVTFCVNTVGVNVNTASKSLLTYVSGLGEALAQNIVNYRREHGAFKNRKELLNVSRLGNSAFTQCAGFLRIQGAENPLDNTAVHPESYSIVNKMASDQGVSVQELINDKDLRNKVVLADYVTDTIGMPTLQDIMTELDKPGRDPREQIENFSFDQSIHDIDDLKVGMILPGIVTNITQFGAFVDIGVHQDGLVHVSQISDRYIKDPTQAVRLHQHVTVKVIDIDLRRNRISLSMKNLQ